MRSGGIAEFEDCVHDRIARRIESNRRIGISHIVVNRAGDTDDVERSLLVHSLNASERAVAADNDEVFDALVKKVFHCVFHNLGVCEFRASRRAKNRTARMHAV